MLDMTELEALRRRRQHLLGQIVKAADEINRIDDRLAFLHSSSLEKILLQ
jgi:hypothetical protein